MKRWMKLAALFVLAAGLARAADTAVEPNPTPAPAQKPSKSLLHKVLMYLPNRALDLVDVFRLRARVGPGLSAHVRATEYLNACAGSYKSVFVGLPGPREDEKLRPLWGREDLKGMMLLGVDATDDTPHAPGYSDSEFNVGAHLLIVGAEVGFDPVQFGDFLAGIIGMDPRGDDR